jgi:hypothetical protein
MIRIKDIRIFGTNTILPIKLFEFPKKVLFPEKWRPQNHTTKFEIALCVASLQRLSTSYGCKQEMALQIIWNGQVNTKQKYVVCSQCYYGSFAFQELSLFRSLNFSFPLYPSSHYFAAVLRSEKVIEPFGWWTTYPRPNVACCGYISYSHFSFCNYVNKRIDGILLTYLFICLWFILRRCQ